MEKLGAKKQSTCFFLDSSILIPEILVQKDERTSKLKKDAIFHNVPCYFSNSVKLETERKVTDTINFIGDTIRNNLITKLGDSRKLRRIPFFAPLTNDDIKDLENFFYDIQGAARAEHTLTDPVSLVEEWIICFLAEKIDKGVTITIMELGTELIKTILKLTVAIRDSSDYLLLYEKGFAKKKNLPPDARFGLVKTNLETEGIHPPDSEHLAFAVLNQILNAEKTIFVTFDYKTILNNRTIVSNNHGLECSDPLYAAHHL